MSRDERAESVEWWERIESERKARSRAQPWRGLTPREIEVVRLLTKGQSNKEIARSLTISTHTAKAHVSSILFKLCVHSRTEAAVTWLGIEPAPFGNYEL